MRPEQCLRAAAQIIREGGLSQGANVRDANGEPVPLWVTDRGRATPNPLATRYSIYGAIVKAIHSAPDGIKRQTLMFDVALRVALRRLDLPTDGPLVVQAVDVYSEAAGRTSEDAASFLEECADECERIGDGAYQPPIKVPDIPEDHP